MHERIPELICPADRVALDPRGSDSLVCRICQRRFPVESGVVRFLEERDAFYEGRFQNTIRYRPRWDRAPWSWPLWLIACGYVWAVRRHIEAASTILELGCGSGIAYLSQRYRTVGVDLSFSSLARVADRYSACLQADVTRGIPLPDASVDGVISSFVWEHFRPEDKPRVMAEIHRVLRPGGKLVFLYDVESGHPLYRRMQSADAALFREVLIDREGHFGWQSEAENVAIFEGAGMRVVEHRGKEKLLINPAMYDKVQQWPGSFHRWAQLGLRFRYGPLFHLYNGASRLLDETIGRVVPGSWARVMVSVCVRP